MNGGMRSAGIQEPAASGIERAVYGDKGIGEIGGGRVQKKGIAAKIKRAIDRQKCKRCSRFIEPDGVAGADDRRIAILWPNAAEPDSGDAPRAGRDRGANRGTGFR